MSYLIRLGCAAVAVVAIAALTSIGLYAVVAGGVLFGAPSPRTTSALAPVLVTIQAAPATPTTVLLPTSTPMPSSLIPGLGQPPAAALALPASPGAAAATPATAQTLALATPPAAGAASPQVAPMAATAPPDGGRQAIHDGLALEVVEVECAWQARQPDSTPARGREGQELLTVHVRLVNRTPKLRFAADGDLLLVADDGARLTPRQAPPLREPHLLTVPVPPGDVVRGWLTYDAPAGTAPRRLRRPPWLTPPTSRSLPSPRTWPPRPLSPSYPARLRRYDCTFLFIANKPFGIHYPD